MMKDHAHSPIRLAAKKACNGLATRVAPEGTHEAHRHIALLELLLICVLLGGLAAVVTPFLLDPAKPVLLDLRTVLPVLALLVTAGMCGVNRMGYYRLAAFVAVFTLSAAAFGLMLLADRPADAWILSYLVIPVLLGSMFLPKRLLALLILLDLAGLLLLPAMLRDVDLEQMPIIFFAMVSGLVLLAGRHRQALERLGQSRLRESQARYKAIAKDMPVLVSRFLPGGEITYVNEAYCKAFDKTHEDLVGASFFSMIPEAERGTVMANISALTAQSPTQSNEHRVMAPGGETRWHRWTNRALFDTKGRVVAYQCIGEDITERKQAKAALRDSEQRFRMLVENSPLGVMRSNADGEATYANEAMCAIFQAEHPGELLGSGWKQFFCAESLEEVEREDKRRLKGIASSYEIEVVAKGGEKRSLIVSGSSLLDQDGKFEGTIATFLDITERKRAEEALEKRILALTRPLDDVASITFEQLFDLDHIQRLQDEFAKATGVASLITRTDGTPITAPSNFCRLCSDIIRKTDKGLANCYKSDAAVGRLHPEGPIVQPCMSGGLCDAGAAISVGGKHIANWLIGQVRDTTQTEDQMRKYAREIEADEEAVVEAFREIPAMSREQFGRVAQALFTLANQLSDSAYQNVQQARFITEHKRAQLEREKLEAQLRQSQKMEAVGQLAGGIAHDFNNLLQAILGYGDMALEQAGPDSPVGASVQEILNAAGRAKALVRQLLAFSRRQVLDMKDVDLNDVVADLMKMIRRLIGEHITLDVVPGHHLGIVRADPGQIEQILMNLCVNARDAMPAGGTITIETENVRIDQAYCDSHPWAQPGRYALLSVTDTGCGMDQDTLSSVFEPFFTTKSVGQGTGLGLSTVYGLVKQHDGMVHVYSEVGKGTAFKVYLPLVERYAARVGDKIEGPVPGGTETILLAEDDATVRKLSQTFLERAGYTVRTASDGEEAIRIFEEHGREIGLALLDLMMPKIGGRGVFEHIRRQAPQTRVLFSSGYSMSAIHTNFVLEQGLQLLQKPYQRNDLLRRVREVLDESPSISG